MSTSSCAKGPFRLLTINTAPERANKVIGQVAAQLADRYLIDHVANCETIEGVEDALRQHQPDLLFCASMWTPTQSEEMINTGKRLIPGIKTYAIPEGLQVKQGPQGVVDHLMEVLPPILDTL